MDPNGQSIPVFDLSDHSVFADDSWNYGQVEVYTRSVTFMVDVDASDGKGWSALDEFIDIENPGCATFPADAAVSTVAPDTPTTPQGKLLFIYWGGGGAIPYFLK